MKKANKEDLIYLLIKILIVGVMAVLLFGVLFGLCRSPDESMKPTLREGDAIVYYRLQKKCDTGDLVLIKINGQAQIRRVIAVAGDSVDITDEGLIINGYHQEETQIYTKTQPYKEGITFPITLKEGQVFVLADNREGTEDSRIYGAIAINDVSGKVLTVIRHRNI